VDFDFSHLPLDNISQLEVLRGPQSTLYGSNASGGVINLTSKRGEGPATGYFSSEGGSRGAAMTRMGVSAGNYIGDFSFAGSFSSTDGISVIDERVFGYTEKDGYRQGSFNLRLGMNPTEILRLDLFANYQKSRFEFDDFPNPYDIEGVSTDNPNLKQRTERFMIRPQVTLSLFDGRWEQTAGFGYVQTERKYRDDPYPGNYLMNWDIWLDDYSSIQRNRYRGETYRFDYKSVFRLHETNTLLAGVDVNTDSIAYQPIYYKKENNPLVPDVTPTVKPGSLTSVGVYLEDQINISDVFFATIGVRQEHHDKFGGKTTWRGSAMYAFPTQTKLKTSAGTGFKAPSLYQLHIGTPAWSIVPNPDLKPETSFGWEAGFEQSLWEDRFTFGAAFFRNQIKDRIDTVYDPLTFTSTYYNIDSYRTWGVESFIQFAITDNLNVSAQYTWLRSDTPRQGWAPYGMFRRPLNEVSANIDWKFLDRGTFTAGVKYIGTRWEGFKVIDHLGNGETGRMPSYTIARIGAAWKFNRHMEVFARVENLFNKKYQEVSGYGTEGIGFFAGATLSF
ncbi:MAG: TonB-dependent receptor, partial [Planctomycetes bacterium]|nr:TonB-dependent receptor [Planctomycetota bacterium]